VVRALRVPCFTIFGGLRWPANKFCAMSAVQLVDVPARYTSLADDSAGGGHPGGNGVSRARMVLVACGCVGLVGAVAAAVAGKAASGDQFQGEIVDAEYRSLSSYSCADTDTAKVSVCEKKMCKKLNSNDKDIISGDFTMVYTNTDGQASWIPTKIFGLGLCRYAKYKPSTSRSSRGLLYAGAVVQVLGEGRTNYTNHTLHEGQWYEVHTVELDFDADFPPVASVTTTTVAQAEHVECQCRDFDTVTETKLNWNITCPTMKETEKDAGKTWKEVVLQSPETGNNSNYSVPKLFLVACKNGTLGAEMKYGWKQAGIPVGATVFKYNKTHDYTKVVVSGHYKTRWVPTWVLDAPVVTPTGKADVFLKQVLTPSARGTQSILYHRVVPMVTSGEEAINCSANSAVTVTTSSQPAQDVNNGDDTSVSAVTVTTSSQPAEAVTTGEGMSESEQTTTSTSTTSRTSETGTEYEPKAEKATTTVGETSTTEKEKTTTTSTTSETTTPSTTLEKTTPSTTKKASSWKMPSWVR